MTIIPQTEPDVNPATPDTGKLTRLFLAALQRRRARAAHKAQWATERGLWTVAREAMARLDAAEREQTRREAPEGGAA